MDQARIDALTEQARRLERENETLRRGAGRTTGVWGLAVIGATVLWIGAAGLRPMAGGEGRGPRSPVGDVFAGIPFLAGDQPRPDKVILVPPPQPQPDGQFPTEKEFWEAFVKERFERPLFLIEKVAVQAEPCVVLPLIGPLRRVSARFKCTVYFDERIGNEVKRDVAVVFVEKGQLDRCDELTHGHNRGQKRP